MSDTNSIMISGWAQSVISCLEQEGINPASILNQVAIEHDNYTVKNTYITGTQLNELWCYAVEATNRHDFGIYVGTRSFPAMLQGFGLAAMLSPNIKVLIDVTLEYCQQVNAAVLCDVTKTETTTKLSFSTKPGHIHLNFDAEEAFIAFWATFPKRFMGLDLDISKVQLRRRKPKDVDLYHEALGKNIEFESYCPVIEVRNSCLLTPSRNDIPAVSGLIKKLILPMSSINNLEKYRDRTKTLIYKHLHDPNLSQNQIAKELNVSVSTLQKKLKAEGGTFSELVEFCKKDMALDYLAEEGRSIKQIAILLGFTSSSNFSRAFRGWFGVSPSKYKDK